MTIEIASILTGVAIVLVAGAIVAVAKHISNSQKHPCKTDIVFADVCKPKMEALSDCLEKEIVERKEAYKDLRADMKAGFEEVKELIRNKRS